MSLIIKTRGDKKYLYFAISGAKRLYLGTTDNPKKENIYQAVQYLRDRVRETEEKISELEKLVPVTKEKVEVGHKIQYDLIFFDLDGVIYEKPWYEFSSDLVAVSTWDLIFQELGIYNVHEKLKRNFETGLFRNYIEWTEAACRVLQSMMLNKKTFEDIINRRPLTQGAHELFQRLHKEGVKIAVVTGSFSMLAERAKKELGGIDEILAHCDLEFDERGLLKSWRLHTIDYEDKASFVERTAKEKGVPLTRCAYVGDDVNDIRAFEKVGCAIAFNAQKVKVLEAADFAVKGRDLRDILPYLYIPSKKNKKSRMRE
jgi:HAD superfamily phosphoserine phosphatase-like hydrolase